MELAINIIDEKLINNPEMENHQITGTLFARKLFNAVLFLPLYLFAFCIGEHPNAFFYSMKTRTQENMKSLTESINSIPEM